MSTQYEAIFHGHNNAEIFYHIWRCEAPVGTILVTHGLAEHSECYKDFAEELNKNNYDVIVYDLRGHGRSEGKRGIVESFNYFCKDLSNFTEYCIKEHNPGHKFFVFGHSLGGLITTKTLLTHEISGVDGVILSSPCLGLKIEVPNWKKKFAKAGTKWFPNLTLWNEIKYEDLIRDTEKANTYATDPLRHDKISPRIFDGMLTGIDFADENKADFNLPLLMQVAGQDKICDPASGIHFYEGCSSKIKKLHVYEESLHEIYNDLDKNIVIKDLLNFLNKFETQKNGDS